jgi:hypothetical protein
MGSGLIIPIEERCASLRDFLLDQTRAVTQIRKLRPTLIPEEAAPFLYLCFPWIHVPAGSDQETLLTISRKEFEAAGFQGARVKEQLEIIRSEDKHLRECCANIGQLAQFLDARFIAPSVNLLMAARSKRCSHESNGTTFA